MEHGHSPEAIAARLAGVARQSHLRDLVYGGIDGAVTTFAVVSGVIGAHLGKETILILGVANLLGDGFSMAASNYLGTRTELQEMRQKERTERRHIAHFPEGEREEIRQIFRKKGIHGDLLEKVVLAISSNPQIWVRTMLSEEYGLPATIRSPLSAAVRTMISFVLCGTVPLVPFVFALPRPFGLSLAATAAVFFAIGSIKSRWSVMSWWKEGLITLTVGACASGLAYVCGVVLGNRV